MREEIGRRWGRRALLSLTFALIAARVFATAKYALGHGRACTRLTVGGGTGQVTQPEPPVLHGVGRTA